MAPRKKSLTSKLNEAAGNPEQTVEMSETSSFMPFEKIKDRTKDTRKLNQKHVRALAMSIADIGLIEPLVVDRDGILLAGGHRKAAIGLLADGPDDVNNVLDRDKILDNLFPGGIPVRIMPFSASDDPEKALQIEIAENEHRRDYTHGEIIAIAERLKDAGFVEVGGRPGKGQKPLMPALSAVVGKSIRQLRRIVNEADGKGKSRSRDRLSNTDQRDRHLKAAISALEKWTAVDGRGRKDRESELSKDLPEIIERLQQGLK